MGSFFVNNPPPAQYASGQYGDFTPRDANGTPSVGTQQAAAPSPQSQQGANQGATTTGTPTSGAPQGDPKQIAYDYAQSLGPPTDENIQKTADYMKSLGYDVKPNPGSDGFWLNGQGWDIVEGYKTGNPKWQQPLIDGVNGGGTGGIFNPANGYGQPYGPGSNLTPTQQIEQTPGYQFDVSQAMNAIQHSAAARGTLLSGGLMKNLGSYIANSVAGPAYQSQINNLYNIAGLGKGAAGMTADAANSYGAGATGLMTGIGNANAGAAIAGGSAYANAANQIGSNVAQGVYNQYNQPNSSSYGNPYGLTPAQQAEASGGYSH